MEEWKGVTHEVERVNADPEICGLGASFVEVSSLVLQLVLTIITPKSQTDLNFQVLISPNQPILREGGRVMPSRATELFWKWP